MSLFGEQLADHAWIGWDLFGEIDRLESESIATRFFCVVIPLWPSYSVYVTRSPDGQQRYIPIGRQPRSVALGYARVSLWLAALVLCVAGIADHDRFSVLLSIGVALAGLAGLLQFGAGQLPHYERARRALLRRVAGIGAPPELLPERLRAEVRAELLDAWYAQSQQTWHEAIDHGVASELLVALAEYHHDELLVLRARMNLVDSTSDRLRWN